MHFQKIITIFWCIFTNYKNIIRNTLILIHAKGTISPKYSEIRVCNDSMKDQKSVLVQSLLKLLKPLVRILLRNGIAYAEFTELAKRTYVEVAHQDFAVEGRKQSSSRVALLTGIHRHDVAKLLKSSPELDAHLVMHNRSARLISAWQTDDDFSTDGVAKPLSLGAEFPLLVSRHGGDVTMRSVLDELLRTGTVRSENDVVTLLVEAFAPENSLEDLLYIFGDSAADLLETMDHNLSSGENNRRLQLGVVYDNLPDDVLRNLEIVTRNRALEFLKDMNQFYSTQDRDSNESLQGEGRNRAGIGLYYFQNGMNDGTEQ